MLFLVTALWGLFWLPLRKIEEAGVSDIWSVVAINAIPLLILCPVVLYRREHFFSHFNFKLLIGIGMGAGMAFYAIAFLYTTVLRTTLLFYMSPIWATLLSMLILKESVAIKRWLAIAVGLAGLILILSGSDGTNSSTAFNRGDVFAILSGLFWGFGTVMIKKSDDIPAIDLVPSQYFFATLTALGVLLTTIALPEFRIPGAEQWMKAMPLIIGFYVCFVLPTIFITTRIAQILSPGRVCLLMMSEVLVAGISAPLLAGEAISAIEWMAGTLIITATLIEVYSSPEEPNPVLGD